jgi:hypothetical protein
MTRVPVVVFGFAAPFSVWSRRRSHQRTARLAKC